MYLFVMGDVGNVGYRIEDLILLPRDKYFVTLICDRFNSLYRRLHIFQVSDKTLVTLLRD